MLRIKKLAIALAVLLPVVAGCGKNDPEAVSAATHAAESWLQLMDRSDYARTWQEAAPVFKYSLSQDGWAKMAKPVREPLGQVKSRTLIQAKYTTSLPGAPDGDYVVLQDRTDFTNKTGAVETITPMLGTDGVWRVSGYFIK